MIQELDIKNFTRFDEGALEFSPGLNVFVGTNGSGKSHILKLLYAGIRAMSQGQRKNQVGAPTKTALDLLIAERLKGVFVPDSLGRLAHRGQGNRRAEVDIRFRSAKQPHLRYSFSTQSDRAVKTECFPECWLTETSVFLPTREMLSLYPGFTSTYESVQIPFEETWYDLALALGKPLPKGPHNAKTRRLLQPLEEALDGKVLPENGRFYIRTQSGKMEAHLLAEGLRKIGTLAQLVANGSLTSHSVLFWDEPEANLNPCLIKLAAQTITGLAKQGMQIFIATHSLFLLRQLYILAPAEHKNGSYRYFSLVPKQNDVTISTSTSMDGLGEIATLSCQCEQDEKLMRIYSNGF